MLAPILDALSISGLSFEPMSPVTAIILGIVEGVTEYLPVSSTGHLVLASHLLGQKSEAAGSFDIVIQLGAILAVVVHYRELLGQRVRGLFHRESSSIQLLLCLIIGFAPTAVLGLLLRKKIKALLMGPKPVALALVVGGIVMIGVEVYRAYKARGRENEAIGANGLEHVTPLRAFYIGLGQCVSMWPGASRSMCTIVAGQLSGLSTATAAEFSFLLGLPTLGAATVYEMIKSRHELGEIGALNVMIGLVVSFVIAWAVIAAFLAYLKKRGLVPFGIYRIALGLVVLWMTSTW